mmetsp:Transcript_7727/g.12287  ORF Transcript_7727/g.12287 Transcript_7727/m.12287 type:complete len:208 (-) Transcript_7727:540-1163(-)
MSLLSIRLPVTSWVLQRGSLVSILVVALVSAGRSPSQYPSPIRRMFAIFTSPCATPQACMHLSARPISLTTLTGTSSGAPPCQLDRETVARSVVPRSKTVHSNLTLRVSPWGLRPPASCTQSTSASSLPLTLRVLSFSVIVPFSTSGNTGISMRCQNQSLGVRSLDWPLPLSSPATIRPPLWLDPLRRRRLRCFTTCLEKAASVGSW